MRGSLRRRGQYLVQAADARVPALLELRQQTIGTTDGVGVAGHALGAAVLALGHQLSTFQDGDVLLHGGKRHRVSRRQLADRRVSDHDARQDVAPGGVGERPEQLVEGLGRRLSMYNHLVVYVTTRRGRPRPAPAIDAPGPPKPHRIWIDSKL
jgi:hypothetical protein